ncbi:hypothetical protein [Staphylothermus hellenicus]|uniref:Uncharacterized protein n=1 Tax=Staphylothermus hellenicus (strain DSM 12710 / JCM 10830 / BK20S6-10-b1 / P8) TaxID=591019 RepID=D7D8H1_STAHD|nr:hypothetical protein [Staphylothermus hellenicus]ADI32067.1 hypothetical protein Shell_0961 [Staphylothermus hellenicus DSM 12710]
MGKVVLSLKHRPDEYSVLARVYDSDGSLVREEGFDHIKQVIIKAGEVRLSRQLSPEPIVIVVDAEKPSIMVKEGALLYICDEGAGKQ